MADQSHKEGNDFNYASITGVSKSCFMQRTSTILFISHVEKQNSEELATYNQAHLREKKNARAVFVLRYGKYKDALLS